MVISKRDDWGASTMMWQISVANSIGGNMTFHASGGGDSIDFGAPTIGQWMHVLATVEGTTLKGYLDGELIDTNSNFTMGTGTDSVLWIGATGNESNPAELFNGLLDEIQLFNYAVDDKGALDLYNDTSPVDKALCLDPYSTNMDVAGADGPGADCRVNLYDLVALTTAWLDCALYPDAACSN